MASGLFKIETERELLAAMPKEYRVELEGKNMSCQEIENRVKLQIAFRRAYYGIPKSTTYLYSNSGIIEHREYVPKPKKKSTPKQHLNKYRTERGLLEWRKIKKQGAECHYCGFFTKQPTRDHIIPKSKGGGLNTENVVIACVHCNGNKADQSYDDFIALGRPRIIDMKNERSLRLMHKMVNHGK